MIFGRCHPKMLCGISTSLEVLSPTQGQVSHALLTRSPLYSDSEESFLVRLACLIHAANVRSEPGSNSPLWIVISLPNAGARLLSSLHCSILAETIYRIDRRLYRLESLRVCALFGFQRAFFAGRAKGDAKLLPFCPNVNTCFLAFWS